MRRISVALCLILLLISAQPHAGAQTGVTVRRVLDDNLFQWYSAQAKAELDPDYAGAYVMEALDNTLYIGLSASVPTHDHAGPLLAALDEAGLRLIAPLREQDINRMRVIGDRLFIPGYDPTAGWDAGNLYIYDPASAELTTLRYRYDTPQFVATTTTGADGQYLFEGLKPSAYIVQFIPPAGYGFTQRQSQGGTFGNDSNPHPDTGIARTCIDQRMAWFRGTTPYYEMSIDAGLIPAADAALNIVPHPDAPPNLTFFGGQMTLGDLVWEDTNGNGIHEMDEAGVAGVRVELYTRDPYFPCVLHASAIWGDAETGTIYMNGGVIYGNVTFASYDGGDTWNILAQDNNNYWAYDMVKFNGFFYKLHRDIRQDGAGRWFTAFTRLLYSADLVTWDEVVFPERPRAEFEGPDGTIWNTQGLVLSDTNALVIFQDQLLVLAADGMALYAIHEAEDYATLPVQDADLTSILPAFPDPDFPAALPNYVTGATNRHNTFANGQDELLYAVGGDNVLYATPDLVRWVAVADFNTIDQGAPLITLTFWKTGGQLVAATAGATGSLYIINHAEVLAQVAQKIVN